MNILHIYKSYYPDTWGGCEKMIKNLAKHTQPLGCYNTLLVSSKTICHKKQEEMQGLSILRYPTSIELASCPISLAMLKDLPDLVQAFDVIHYHFPWPYAECLHLLTRIKKPSIVTYHSDIVKQKYLKILYRPFMNRFLKKMNCIVTTSSNYLASSSDLIPYQNKSVVIPIGIEDSTQIDADRVNAWRMKIGENFLLYVGVLRYYKGVNVLLEAIKDLFIPLVIIGSGPLEKALKIQAEKNKLKQVVFLGSVSEVDKFCLLKLCHAVVLPSIFRSEAYGISLLEGIMFGKPIISTELQSGTSFINQHYQTGFVVAPNQAIDLRAAIETLFNNPLLAKQFGQAGRQRYLAHFTANKMAKKYVEVYLR